MDHRKPSSVAVTSSEFAVMHTCASGPLHWLLPHTPHTRIVWTLLTCPLSDATSPDRLLGNEQRGRSRGLARTPSSTPSSPRFSPELLPSVFPSPSLLTPWISVCTGLDLISFRFSVSFGCILFTENSIPWLRLLESRNDSALVSVHSAQNKMLSN